MHTVSKVDTIFPWSNRKYTLSLHRNTNKKNENMTLPHIGELIKAEVERQGLTKAVFAETIGTTTRNVHKIFKKENLDLIFPSFGAVCTINSIKVVKYQQISAK